MERYPTTRYKTHKWTEDRIPRPLYLLYCSFASGRYLAALKADLRWNLSNLSGFDNRLFDSYRDCFLYAALHSDGNGGFACYLAGGYNAGSIGFSSNFRDPAVARCPCPDTVPCLKTCNLQSA